MAPAPYSKHLIRLFRGDFERLAVLHRSTTPSAIVRDLVRRHITELEQVLQDLIEEER